MDRLTMLFGIVSQLLSNHLDTIVAVFVLWLSYRLVRVGLENASQPSESFEWHRYFALVAPGVGLAIFGVIFVLGKDPISLAMYFVTFIIFVGFGFAILGYRLFTLGVLGSSDVEAVWKDTKLLMRRAAPGTLFAFFGLLMISATLWRAPTMLESYFTQQRLSDQALYTLINGRSKDALALIGQYLGQRESQAPAFKPSTSPTTAVGR